MLQALFDELMLGAAETNDSPSLVRMQKYEVKNVSMTSTGSTEHRQHTVNSASLFICRGFGRKSFLLPN